jgi:hypothetical protein
MNGRESTLQAKTVNLNEYAIRATLKEGNDMEARFGSTAVNATRIGPGATHTFENPSGKGIHIFQVVSGGPISLAVTGKTARFREPFLLESGYTEQRTGGGSYPWSFVGNHLIIEDAVTILVTLSKEQAEMGTPTVYTVIRIN